MDGTEARAKTNRGGPFASRTGRVLRVPSAETRSGGSFDEPAARSGSKVSARLNGNPQRTVTAGAAGRLSVSQRAHPLVRTMCLLRLRSSVALSLSRGVVVKRYPCGPKFAKVVVFNFVVSINFYHSKQSKLAPVQGQCNEFC